MEKAIDQVAAYLDASITVQRRVAGACAKQILDVADAMTMSLKAGKKALFCGNGGSAADCEHMATELMSRLSRGVDRPALAAIALTSNGSFLTAYGNDDGFEGVFERQVQALGLAGDVLIAISTSGNSPNVLKAVRAATDRGMYTVALTGSGGQLAGEVNTAVVIPDRDTQRIQEALLPVEHLICSLVERAMFGDLPSEAGE